MEISHRIKLPNLETSFKGSKQDSPWHELQAFVINHFGGLDKTPITSISDVWIHPLDYMALEAMTFKWGKKRLRGFTDKYVKSQLAFLSLDVSPAHFQIDNMPDDIVPGFVYIRKSK